MATDDNSRKKADEVIKSTSSYLTLLGPDGHVFRWLIPSLGAVISFVAAYATAWLKPFGIIGWVFAGLAGAILCALLVLMIEQARLSRAKRQNLSVSLDDPTTWAKGLSVMSICDMSCAIAGVLPSDFEKSGRARAIATEIQSRVNDGWVPIDAETSQKRSGGMIVEIVGKPNFKTKSVDLMQPLYVRDVEHFCSRQDWNFAWAHSAVSPNTKGLIEIEPQ